MAEPFSEEMDMKGVDCMDNFDSLSRTEAGPSTKVVTKDLKAMGLAAGGKLGTFRIFAVLDRLLSMFSTRTFYTKSN